MSTIAEFRLPASDTVLAVAFERIPEVRFELESSVSKTLPCLWVSNTEPNAIEAAFDDDSTVSSYELLVESDERLLYDIEFDEDYLYDGLLAEGGSLLEARGVDGWWQVRMRFRDRDELCRTHDHLVDCGVNADLRRVTDIARLHQTDTRLTPQQQEALTAALERGYFEIPRGISMEELAAELGISHQALSERLRRAYETLVDAELQPANEPPNSD